MARNFIRFNKLEYKMHKKNSKATFKQSQPKTKTLPWTPAITKITLNLQIKEQNVEQLHDWETCLIFGTATHELKVTVPTRGVLGRGAEPPPLG